MQPGIHVVERAVLPGLEARGLEAPQPWVGVLDLIRAIEGLRPEPAAGRPLVVVGLDALVEAAGDEAAAVLSQVRRGLHEGRAYFEWAKIPLVLVVEGALEPLAAQGSGLELVRGRRRWPLAPLLGVRVEQVGDHAGWWWSPQIA